MDVLIGQQESLSSPRAMTDRVLSDARRAFGDSVDAPLLERYAEEAVNDLWQDSIRVKTFVPVLALRRIHEMIEEGKHALGGRSPDAA